VVGKGHYKGRGCYFVPWEIISNWSDSICSSEILCFYCHCFRSTEIAVGFVGFMLKGQQNESPYNKSVTVTETVFPERTVD